MEAVYDRFGNAVAYLHDDKKHIYLFNGDPVAFILDEHIFSFSGRYLGWVYNGWFYDRSGRPAFFFTDATGGPIKPVRKVKPTRSVRRVRPVKGIRELRPVKPTRSLTWSDYSNEQYFNQ